MLRDMLKNGGGGEVDYNEARRLYALAAEQQHEPAANGDDEEEEY